MMVHWMNLLIVVQILLSEHIFAPYLERRDRYWLRLTLSGGVCMAVAYFFPVLESHYVLYGIFLYTTLFALSVCSVLLCYRESPWTIGFCCLAGYTVQHLGSTADTLLRQIIRLLGGQIPQILSIVTGFVLVYLLCRVAFRRSLKDQRQLMVNNRQLLVLAGVAFLVDVALALFPMAFVNRYGGDQTLHGAYRTVLSTYDLLCCVGILSLMVVSLSNRKLKQELALMTQMLEQEKKHFQLSKETIDIINLKCHDLRHQIRSLRTDTRQVTPRALKEIEQAVDIYDGVFNTGNPALDVILTEKSLLCGKSGIRLSCIADGTAIGFLAEEDIYALFGNALDNAMEAVQQLPDPAERGIGLRVQAVERLLSIHLENRFAGTLTFREGLPLTGKQDHRFHGFGMRSMSMIAEKYGGCLTASAKGQVFHLNVMIPIPAQSRPAVSD